MSLHDDYLKSLTVLLRDAYLKRLTALLRDADGLDSTPDDMAARVLVLAELRQAIAAGLGGEAASVKQPQPSKGRLVWYESLAGASYLVPPGGTAKDGVYEAIDCTVARHPDGGPRTDRQQTADDRPAALHLAAEWARADGYECDDHPDAAVPA